MGWRNRLHPDFRGWCETSGKLQIYDVRGRYRDTGCNRGYPGNGSGYGYGGGIKSINGIAVYKIDDVETVIYSIFGNYAKGAILRSDLTLSPCYIAKQDGFYAHGNTIREAREELEIKLYEDMPQEERIEAFVNAHDLDKSYPTMEFFGWHNCLTGSCEMGRREFAKEHNIDLNGNMTTREFLELTKDAYGGKIIRETMEAYGK